MPAGWNQLWEPEKEQLLRECIAAKMSAGKTAQIMGITPGAANGKAHRLGLKFLSQPGHLRKPAGGKRPSGFNRKSAAKIIAIRHDPGEEALPIPVKYQDFLGKTLFDLGQFECHYIEGDNRLYCGQPAEREKSYCRFHCGMMFQKPAPRIERLSLQK